MSKRIMGAIVLFIPAIILVVYCIVKLFITGDLIYLAVALLANITVELRLLRFNY
jgi:hypothetical protein